MVTAIFQLLRLRITCPGDEDELAAPRTLPSVTVGHRGQPGAAGLVFHGAVAAPVAPPSLAWQTQNWGARQVPRCQAVGLEKSLPC